MEEKALGWKKILIIGGVVMAVIAICWVIGLLKGKGVGKGQGDGAGSEQSKTVFAQELCEKEQPEQEEPVVTEEPKEELPEDAGGEENVKEEEEEVNRIAILVSGSEYFYENAPITLDETVSMIDSYSGELVVEVTDNNATYRAYHNLLGELDELRVPVTELLY